MERILEIKKNRRNSLYTKKIDYTVVEEFLDDYFADDPVPVSVTKAIKSVSLRFQRNKEYTGQSIHDAVHDYYDTHFGGSKNVRNMCLAMSNNTRTLSEATHLKMSRSATGNKNRLGKGKVINIE